MTPNKRTNRGPPRSSTADTCRLITATQFILFNNIQNFKKMETKVIESPKAKTENKSTNPVTEENKNPKFVAGNAINKDSAKPEAEKPKEAPKAEAPKAAEQPKAEATKAEVKAEQQKPVLNLEGTLKLVEELHRRKIQRDKLI